MALLPALVGLWLCVVMVSCSNSTDDNRRQSMPPFMFLSPPSFRAGHTVSLLNKPIYLICPYFSNRNWFTTVVQNQRSTATLIAINVISIPVLDEIFPSGINQEFQLLRKLFQTTLKLMMFTENRGNISIKYYNYTRQYYPENLYEE